MTDRERDDWIKVAEALGLRHKPVMAPDGDCEGVVIYPDDRGFQTWMQSEYTPQILHGLACLRANGRCWWAAGGSVWYWDINGDKGEASSHPQALLAMLKAHDDG